MAVNRMEAQKIKTGHYLPLATDHYPNMKVAQLWCVALIPIEHLKTYEGELVTE